MAANQPVHPNVPHATPAGVKCIKRTTEKAILISFQEFFIPEPIFVENILPGKFSNDDAI